MKRKEFNTVAHAFGRMKQGRPRIEDEPQRRRVITICDRLIDKARRIGGGNVSLGMRKALEQYKE